MRRFILAAGLMLGGAAFATGLSWNIHIPASFTGSMSFRTIGPDQFGVVCYASDNHRFACVKVR